MGVFLRGKNKDIYWIDFYYEGRRYTEKVGKVSKGVAEEKLDIKRSEVIRGEWKPKVTRTLFDKFKEQYLEWSRGNKKRGSSLRDECSLKHLSRFFEGKALSEISSFMVEKYKLTRKEEGGGPATINRELGCLRHMLNQAIKWKRVQVNPVREVKFLKEPKEKDRILSEEEEVRLLGAVRTGHKARHLEPIIITALNTGMRKGEILNLKWSNVDFKNGIIIVEGTKNGEIRKIPMNKKLTETLDGAKKVSKGEFVFSENGKPYRDIKTGWWTALENAKIENFTFHGLRHTFGSRLGMKGYDIKTIAELMGHKDIKMTMRYSHPTSEHKRNAVESLCGEKCLTTIFTTPAKTEEMAKVVNIRNR
jgi:integrase